MVYINIICTIFKVYLKFVIIIIIVIDKISIFFMMIMVKIIHNSKYQYDFETFLMQLFLFKKCTRFFFDVLEFA